MPRYGKRRRQAGRFNAYKVYQTLETPVRLVPDNEVLETLAFYLRPYAGHVWHESGLSEPLYNLARAVIEYVALFRVHAVVEFIDVFPVGAKTQPAGHVRRRMHPQAGQPLVRHGVHEHLHRRSCRIGKIRALAVREPVTGRIHVNPRHPGDFVGGKPRRVDHCPRKERIAFIPDAEDVSAVFLPYAPELAAEGEKRAGCGGRGVEYGHVPVGIEYSRPGRINRGVRRYVRLHPRHIRFSQHLKALDAVKPAVSVQRLKRGHFIFVRGDYELAEPFERDGILFAETIEKPRALHAQRRLQRARRVIDAGVDNLAVSAARLASESLAPLEHDDAVVFF